MVDGFIKLQGVFSDSSSLPLTPRSEFQFLQRLRGALASVSDIPITDPGLSVGRPYISRAVQSIHTFSETSESFHFGSCAEMVSAALPAF